MKKEQKTVLVQNVYQLREGVVSSGTSIEYYLKWRAFIDYINTVGEADPTRIGSTYGAIYGINNGVGWSGNINDFPDNHVFDTLDNAIEILGISLDFNVDDYVKLWNQKVVLNGEDIVEITSSNSDHRGCFAYEYETVEISNYYGGGIALEDESSSLYDNRDHWFVTDSASSYNLHWSNYHGYYVDAEDDDTHYGVVSYNGRRDWFSSDEYVWCDDNDTYYVNRDVAQQFNVVWSDSRCEYVLDEGYDDEEDNIQQNNANYHSGLTRVTIDHHAKWRIGFEVEKEDGDAGSIHYRQLYDRTQWCKESDGSLDSNIGYELISPVYDLYGNSLDTALKDPEIRTLIDASHSSNCGGHIHVSCGEYNTDQLFEGFSGFYPLLYALYEFRVDKSYCQAKKKHEYYRKDKYSAVYIRDYTVEFRIFSAVKNVDNLLWRRDLIRIMADNFNKSEFDVLKMMVNPTSKLYKHLRKVFPQDRMMDKVRLFVKYADLYGNKKLPMPNKTPKDNLPNTHELGA